MELDISATSFFDTQTFTLIVLPVLIFIARKSLLQKTAAVLPRMYRKGK